MSVESGDRPDARRAFETALTRALASAHGVVGGAVDAEVLEGSVAVVSGGGGSSSGAVNAVSAGHDTPTDTVHLAGVVKAPALHPHPEEKALLVRTLRRLQPGVAVPFRTLRLTRKRWSDEVDEEPVLGWSCAASDTMSEASSAIECF